jgi:hypothetical protein
MESHQPQKNQEIEGLPEGQVSRPRRFRIVKLEERIAPKKGGHGKPSAACPPTGLGCVVTDGGCEWPEW